MINQIASVPESEILCDIKSATEADDIAMKPDSVVGSLSDSTAIKIDTTRWPIGFGRIVVLSSLAIGVALFANSVFAAAFGALSIVTALLLWLAIVYLMWRHLDQHPHSVFGAANAVTVSRIVVTVLIASLVPVASQITQQWVLWSIACVATITLCMDGLDGYLARKHKQCSAFGARLDMETDALLGLVITLFLWQSGTTGFWILGLGLMRYAFLLGSLWLPALKRKLFPSMRRKAVCVIQVGALCLMLLPTLSPLHINFIGVFALAFLVYSFGVDIHWLLRHSLPDADQE